MVAITITAVAGSAVLLGMSSALQNTANATDQTIGLGMAQQLMSEISEKFYCATKNSPYDTPLGANSSDTLGFGRSGYSNLASYNGLRTEPAKDPFGVTLGTDNGTGGTRNPALNATNSYFTRWRQEVDVYYVSNTDQAVKLTGTNTSDFRCVEVRIKYDDPVLGLRPITTLKQVFAYVAAP